MVHFPQPTAYHAIGKIKKIKGLAGDMLVDLYYPSFILDTCALFLHIKHTYVPYLVAAWRAETWHAWLRLHEVNHRSQASTLRGYTIYLPKDLVEQTLEAMGISLVGYQVIDARLGLLGSVSTMLDNTVQKIAEVVQKGNMRLVPLEDAFVTAIDKTKKIIHTELPDGYLKNLENLEK